MGMFDYVQCNARLPLPQETRIRHRENPFQSKSIRLWEHPDWTERAYEGGCLTVTISPDFEVLAPDGYRLRWSGDLIFYSVRHEFVAECIGGIVQSIRCTEPAGKE